MKKLFNISLYLCLLGLLAGFTHSANSSHTAGDFDSAIYSTPLPYLFLAEEVHSSGSEIDPQKSLTADWENQENTTDTTGLYITRTKGVIVSQSPRTLIFPFHSFL